MKTNDRKLLIVLAIVMISAFIIIWNSQVVNLHRTREHLEQIAPKWKEFQRSNSGFEQVSLTSVTIGNGMFAAIGEVRSEVEVTKLKRFMEETNPPRPIYLNAVRVLEFEEKQLANLAEQTKQKPNKSEMATPRKPSD